MLGRRRTAARTLGLGHKASGSANSWDKEGLRRGLEQVSERTTFLFLNHHISSTARMEQVGEKQRSQVRVWGGKRGWEVGGAVGERRGCG